MPIKDSPAASPVRATLEFKVPGVKASKLMMLLFAVLYAKTVGAACATPAAARDNPTTSARVFKSITIDLFLVLVSG